MKRAISLATILCSAALLIGCGPKDVGDVSLGVFTLKDIKINHFVDPKIPGVTCHISSIEANLSFSDPSNNSVACRQTGPITAGMIAAIDKSKSGEVLFERSKSIFLKTLKIRRIYDEQTQTLLYLAYTTKETSGSFHHSLSSVPLWGTGAYVARPEAPTVSP